MTLDEQKTAVEALAPHLPPNTDAVVIFVQPAPEGGPDAGRISVSSTAPADIVRNVVRAVAEQFEAGAMRERGPGGVQ